MKTLARAVIATGAFMTLAWTGCKTTTESAAPVEQGGPTMTPAAVAAAPPAARVRTRAEIPERHRWNLADIFADESAFEAAFKKVDQMVRDMAALKGTLGQSDASLLAGLTARDTLMVEFERVLVHAGLSYHEDMSNNAAQGCYDRAESLGTRVSEAVSWFTPELLTIPWETADSWMGRNEKLAVYRHYLEDVHRLKPHVLSPREEELLAMAGDVTSAAETIFSRFTNTNLDFPKMKDEHGNEVQLSNARFTAFMESHDRRVRRDAFLGLHETYQAKANTLSAALSAQVKQHMFYAKARHYGSSLEAALAGPNIPVAVYDNLIATVHANLPKLHRYVSMRKRLMGLEEIRRFDLYAPLVDAGTERIDYDDAAATILTALRPLGDDYVGVLKNAFESRWIDVYETENKRSGAYCWGGYLTHPYLLLNYEGTMNDRSTVAHEMGHAMHSHYTVKNQPMVYGDYATFCAEVASTVNEVLLAHHLLNHAESDTERLLILQKQIEGIRTTVFRQTMFAEYEKLIHEQAEAGHPLTGEGLCKTYADLVVKYDGPEIVLDDSAAAECLRIPHFYRNFYVFNYATSHCAATNIGRRIIRGEPGAVDGLMAFLAAGSSKYPLDVLKLAGVDMTTPQPIADTMELFDELLTEFEALYAKRAAATAS